MVKVLIVIDYQKDFVDGSLGFPKAEELDPIIARKVRAHHPNPVFYTLDTHDEDYLDTQEGEKLPVPHCIKGTEGHKIYGETKEALEDVKAIPLEKFSFGITPQGLQEQCFDYYFDEISSIEVVGVVTNICVLSNVIILKTMYPETEIIVDAEGCASFDEELHEKTLDVLEGMQVVVRTR